MKILKIIGLIIVILVVGLGLTGMLLSGEARLERSIVIEAPVEKVFKELNTFNNVYEWSPWMNMDPDMKTEFSGPEYGVGATYSWQSEDPNVGFGSQTLTESRENEYIKTEMTFDMPGENYAEYILEPDGEGTKLTWTYYGKTSQFMMKFMMLGLDSFLGPQYEQGLADLKTYIEGLPDPEPEMAEPMAMDSTVVSEE
jgi:uncharacterized protein YndB with AHSA1/START domain